MYNSFLPVECITIFFIDKFGNIYPTMRESNRTLVVSRKRWAERVARIKDKKKARKTLPGMPEAKIQLGGKMRRSDDNINIDLNEMKHEVNICLHRP